MALYLRDLRAHTSNFSNYKHKSCHSRPKSGLLTDLKLIGNKGQVGPLVLTLRVEQGPTRGGYRTVGQMARFIRGARISFADNVECLG